MALGGVVLPTDWNYTGSTEQLEALSDYRYAYPAQALPQQETPWWETAIRTAWPGTAFDDYFVGASRIVTGRVGDDNNPTWSEAWRETDREIGGGWLPGGTENPVNQWWDENKDDVKDTFKDIGKAILALGAAVLLSRGKQ